MSKQVEIERPLAIYVDESGSPQFKGKAAFTRDFGFVACAVAIPWRSGPRVHALIPRNEAGRQMKASDPEMNGLRLATFVCELLATEVDIALLLFDTSSNHNAEATAEFTADVNANREARGNRSIRSVHLMHLLPFGRVIRQSWARTCARQRYAGGLFDVIIDDVSIPNREKRLLGDGFRRDWLQQGLAPPRLRWKRAEEPLLLVPNLVASVYRRQASRQDVPEACDLLENALRKRRIWLEDEWRTRRVPRPATGNKAPLLDS